MTHRTTPLTLNVTTMQFGQPYRIGDATEIAEEDGVFLSAIIDGGMAMNARLSPEQAFDLAKHLSESAHKAHVHRLRGSDERVTISSILSLGRKRL